MKKAQIEIVGLAVIIIILAVGLVIALTFILRPKADTLEDQRQNIRATALLNALIDTNTNLDLNDGKKIKDLITECYSIKSTRQINCNNELKPILEKIFKNQDYILIIKQEFNDPIVNIQSDSLSSNSCSGDRIVTEPVVIVATPRMTIVLTLCN